MKKAVSKTDYSLIQGNIVGSIISIVLFVCGAMLAASFIINGQAEENYITYSTYPILFLGAAIGNVVSTKMVKKQLAIVVLINIAIQLVALVGLNLILFEASFENAIGVILSVIAGSICACLVSAKGKKSRPTRSHR